MQRQKKEQEDRRKERRRKPQRPRNISRNVRNIGRTELQVNRRGLNPASEILKIYAIPSKIIQKLQLVQKQVGDSA